ncbi:hypothetical protein CORC01_13025 [Colletotrichum orchidophilum]|uniref:Extracellular membrane protein CFEM domain-containing protein n=1 Tax=Colletotrichum orchidophilum TaxID=1209926 RepID=A0A1G4AR94_9PEZI|nr:uncharacterized protein CORC01_13025 [Colletotrichum orchidophilum]OHE91679.1 hypothetical protein CORC01_13025 [Colletotrichum orchidophilum]
MQLSCLALFAATAAALALPQPIPKPDYDDDECDMSCSCRKAYKNTYCTDVEFKDQWNCINPEDRPPRSFIRQTDYGAAPGRVTVYCTV